MKKLILMLIVVVLILSGCSGFKISLIEDKDKHTSNAPAESRELMAERLFSFFKEVTLEFANAPKNLKGYNKSLVFGLNEESLHSISLEANLRKRGGYLKYTLFFTNTDGELRSSELSLDFDITKNHITNTNSFNFIDTSGIGVKSLDSSNEQRRETEKHFKLGISGLITANLGDFALNLDKDNIIKFVNYIQPLQGRVNSLTLYRELPFGNMEMETDFSDFINEENNLISYLLNEYESKREGK